MKLSSTSFGFGLNGVVNGVNSINSINVGNKTEFVKEIVRFEGNLNIQYFNYCVLGL